MRESGLTDLFASLRREIVYVGASAGSLVVTSRFGDTYIGRTPPSGSDIKCQTKHRVEKFNPQPG
jgi:dipeptidase E